MIVQLKSIFNNLWLMPLFFLNAYDLSAQAGDRNTIVVEPILIDEADLSGLDMPKVALKDHPNRQFFQKELYSGSELSVYLLSSETADNEFESFPIEEFVYLMNGKAVIEPKKSEAFNFYTKDFIVVPKGYEGKWKNIGASSYHLELSVIAKNRAAKEIYSKASVPFSFDKDVLSGVTKEKQIYSGIELNIKISSESPTERKLHETKKEQFYHILNGMVTITTNKNSQTFYVGDFFVLPKNFDGEWKTQAKGEFRAIIVEESDLLSN